MHCLILYAFFRQDKRLASFLLCRAGSFDTSAGTGRHYIWLRGTCLWVGWTCLALLLDMLNFLPVRWDKQAGDMPELCLMSSMGRQELTFLHLWTVETGHSLCIFGFWHSLPLLVLPLYIYISFVCTHTTPS